MEVLKLTETNAQECVVRAAAVLRDGGVILYPTDTLYGLGADALSDEAVAKVQKIKGRDENKPIHAIVAGLAMAETYVIVNKPARLLAKKFLPGPLTLVLKKKANVHSGIGRGMDTFGIRIPDNEFCLALAREFGKPYTTTSANRAGDTSQLTPEAILAQLGESAASIIDLIVDAGILPEKQPSTIVDVSAGEVKILRNGAIPGNEFLHTM